MVYCSIYTFVFASIYTFVFASIGREFWLKWDAFSIAVGRGGDTDAEEFMRWDSDEPIYTINSIALATEVDVSGMYVVGNIQGTIWNFMSKLYSVCNALHDSINTWLVPCCNTHT